MSLIGLFVGDRSSGNDDRDRLRHIGFSADETEASFALGQTSFSLRQSQILLKFAFDAIHGPVKALITIEHDTDDSFKFFTKSYCTTISPRTTRELERIRLNLNVLLSTTRQGCLDAPIKSLTFNISRQGCFICSCEEWQLNQEVWFVFKEMENHTPICGRICWLIPWGEALRFPGIGVLFAEIQDDQLLELDRWFP